MPPISLTFDHMHVLRFWAGQLQLRQVRCKAMVWHAAAVKTSGSVRPVMTTHCWHADGPAAFDRNKRENVNDVGCVYNFVSRSARDRFYDMVNTDIQAGGFYSSEPCVNKVWLWRME